MDPLELTGWLLPDWEAIIQAQMTIELFADEDVIRSGAKVVQQPMAVMEAATAAFERPAASAQPRWRRAVHHVYSNLVPLKRSKEAEQRTRETVRKIGRELRQFASLTRKHLGINDPGAIIRAFPELFADARGTRGATGAATVNGPEESQ
jgi:hypothetical protein